MTAKVPGLIVRRRGYVSQRRYINVPQCLHMVPRKGGLIPRQCACWALPGKAYCKYHVRQHEPPRTSRWTPEQRAAGQRKTAELSRQRGIARRALKEAIRVSNPNHLTDARREAISIAQKERWRRRKEAIARGEIVPKKRRPPDLAAPPVQKGDPPTLRLAKRIIGNERRALPAIPEKPFEEMTPYEQLGFVRGQGLKLWKEVLSHPFDPAGDPKLAVLQVRVASDAVGLQVKVDRQVLQAQKTDKMADLLARLKGEAAHD